MERNNWSGLHQKQQNQPIEALSKSMKVVSNISTRKSESFIKRHLVDSQCTVLAGKSAKKNNLMHVAAAARLTSQAAASLLLSPEDSNAQQDQQPQEITQDALLRFEIESFKDSVSSEQKPSLETFRRLETVSKLKAKGLKAPAADFTQQSKNTTKLFDVAKVGSSQEYEMTQQRSNQVYQTRQKSQTGERQISRIRRAEKSLGEICRKFLNQFGAEKDPIMINLEECVDKLGIERRRIYDVVNILEAFQLIKREAKNLYTLEPAINLGKKISLFEEASGDLQIEQFKKELVSFKTNHYKSLGTLCFVFIRLFLQQKRVLSIEEASDYIFKNLNLEDECHTQFKSKTRRLYDIANVLKQLGIVKKVKNSQKKNAFEWHGSKGFYNQYMKQSQERASKVIHQEYLSQKNTQGQNCNQVQNQLNDFSKSELKHHFDKNCQNKDNFEKQKFQENSLELHDDLVMNCHEQEPQSLHTCAGGLQSKNAPFVSLKQKRLDKVDHKFNMKCSQHQKSVEVCLNQVDISTQFEVLQTSTVATQTTPVENKGHYITEQEWEQFQLLKHASNQQMLKKILQSEAHVASNFISLKQKQESNNKPNLMNFSQQSDSHAIEQQTPILKSNSLLMQSGNSKVYCPVPQYGKKPQ